MNKKSFLKIIGFILLISIILLLVHTFRNFIIISNLQDKLSKYTDSDNFHIKSVTNESNGIIITMNYYQKDNRQAIFLERNNNGDLTKLSMYNNGERIDTFTETADSKTVKINSSSSITVQIVDVLKTDNSWQTFLYSILARIKTVNYNGKTCYSIENFLSPYYIYGTEKNEVYLDKETGLLLRQTLDNIISEKDYEFNSVEDSIFVEPDISQYKLQEIVKK